MSRQRKDQFEDQLRSLQEDISYLSNKLSVSSNVTDNKNDDALMTKLSHEEPIGHVKGQVSRLQKELHASRRELDDANFRLEQATHEIEELKNLHRDVGKYKSVIEQYHQDNESLKISLESSERIRKQQKELIQLMQRSHVTGSAAASGMSASFDGSVTGHITGQSPMQIHSYLEEEMPERFGSSYDNMGKISRFQRPPRGTSANMSTTRTMPRPTSITHDGYVSDGADSLPSSIHPIPSTRGLHAVATKEPMDSDHSFLSNSVACTIESHTSNKGTGKVLFNPSPVATISAAPPRPSSAPPASHRKKAATPVTNTRKKSASTPMSNSNKAKGVKKTTTGRKTKKASIGRDDGVQQLRDAVSLSAGDLRSHGYDSDASYASVGSRGGRTSVAAGVPPRAPHAAGFTARVYTPLSLTSTSAPSTPTRRVLQKELATTAAGTYTRASTSGRTSTQKTVSRRVSTSTPSASAYASTSSYGLDGRRGSVPTTRTRSRRVN